MPLLITCWRLSRLMRHCFLGRWTCLLVSEIYRLVWRCRLFDVFRLVCVDMEAYACSCWFHSMKQGFGLDECICQKYYVTGLVRGSVSTMSKRYIYACVCVFIVISITFQPICPPAFRCLSNSGTFTELRTTSFIESMGVTCVCTQGSIKK